MKLVIEDPKTAAKFEILFSNLVSLTDYVKICITDNGLHIQGMDQSKICLFDIVLTCEWFTIFETDDDDLSIFTIPSKIFYKVLSTYKPDQCLEIDINDSDKLHINFLRGAKTCDKFFVLPMIDVHIDLINMSSQKDSDAEIVITSKKLAELVGQLEIFDDVISFSLSEKHVLLKTSGDDGSMTAKLSLDDNQLLDYAIVEDLEIEMSFSLRYVKKMMSFSKLSDDVKIDISVDRPLIISYCLGNESELKLVLAPRLE
jgi:proliferating cell nuclear antigen